MNKKQFIFIDCNRLIPEESVVDSLSLNLWISPHGKIYCIDGAFHEKSAQFIAIIHLGANEKTLKKGTYFNESWEGWLLKQGWCNVKNLSWLGVEKPSTFSANQLTEKQKTVLFDYCEKFNFDWKEMIENNI